MPVVNILIQSPSLVLLAVFLTGYGQQTGDSRVQLLLADAQSAQSAGNYAAAAADYEKVVTIRPQEPELWANLGLMQQEMGEIPAAMVSFREANRRNPSLYVPNLFLGIDDAHIGNASAAIPFLLKAEKINGKDPQAPLALGRAYIAANRFSAAVRELDRATVLDSKLGPAWFTLGIALLDQVEDDARTMSEQNKQSAFAGALYAESLAKQGRFGEAASLYKTLLDARDQPPCIRSELGFALLRGHDAQEAATVFAAEGAAHPECGLALLGQARLAIDSGDTARAVEILNDLWTRDHGFVESNAAILLEGLPAEKASAVGFALSGNESAQLSADLRNALTVVFGLSGQDSLDEAKASPPNRASVDPRDTAEEYYRRGQFELCARRIETGGTPMSSADLRLLAACSLLTGDNRRASSAAAALRARESQSLEALYWSIQSNERLAFGALARFQELEPDSARSHVLLGDIYHQLERYDDAEAEYLKALAMVPGDPAAMLGLATAYLSDNNNKGAMEIAQSALSRSPQDPELNLVMAEALMGEHQYAEAGPYLDKSLHAKPQMLPRIHALIGKTYAETGRDSEAIEQLKLGASSDEDGSVQYLLAHIYRRLGDDKDATEALDRMKTIKQQREARGYKRVEDPDLAPVESGSSQPSAP